MLEYKAAVIVGCCHAEQLGSGTDCRVVPGFLCYVRDALIAGMVGCCPACVRDAGIWAACWRVALWLECCVTELLGLSFWAAVKLDCFNNTLLSCVAAALNSVGHSRADGLLCPLFSGMVISPTLQAQKCTFYYVEV